MNRPFIWGVLELFAEPGVEEGILEQECLARRIRRSQLLQERKRGQSE